MNGPLSSSREGGSNNYYGHGGGGPRHGGQRRDYRSGGRGGHRGGRGGGFRGRGRGFRSDHPYGRGGRGRGDRSSNRFYAEPQHNDPRSTLLKQLNELLHQVGQLPDPSKSMEDPAINASESNEPQQRWVVKTMSQNVTSLASVLCAKSDLFLQASPNSTDASMVAGPLASGLVQAAAVGPLQTPCYAALALAVQQQDSFNSSGGMMMTDPSMMVNSAFAQRTVQYAMQMLARDLDSLLLIEPPQSQPPPTPDFRGPRGNIADETASLQKEQPARTVLRVRLVLRYLGLLSQLGIVAKHSGDGPNGDAGFDPIVFVTNHQPVSFRGLLQSLVHSASLLMHGGGGVEQANPNLAILLVHIIYSSIPFLSMQDPPGDELFWQEQIVQPLQSILDSYRSDFEPGMGSQSILLKYEQLDENVSKDMEEEEEEESDDEDDEGASGQICDSFQDLNRCVQALLSSSEKKYRFALFNDAPWNELKKPKPASSGAMETEGQDAAQEDNAEPAEPLVFTGEPLLLSIFPESIAMTVILGGSAAMGDIVANTQFVSQVDFQGIIVGRLPIFGPPADPDEEEDEEDMEDGTPKSERLEAYSKTFGLVDRYFIAEAVRDCLVSHEPKVTGTGVEKGTIKAVAEQVWSIRQLCRAHSEDNSVGENDGGKSDIYAGLEFVVIETVVSMIVQASAHNELMGLTYLSRVLLELVKLEPVSMTAATVHAVSTLVEDYMPSLVPSARYNLSQWFAFHLIHSNYQWPEGYWNHWASFAKSGWSNSRGAFVKDALSLMMENSSNPASDLLPNLPKSIGETLAPGPLNNGSPPQIESLTQDLGRRIWEMSEDHSTISPSLVGDELQESLSSDLEKEEKQSHRLRWRTKLVVRALLSPIVNERSLISNLLESGPDGDQIEQDGFRGNEADTLSQLLDGFSRYKPLLEAAFVKDMDDGGDSNAAKLDCENVTLDQIVDYSSYSRTVMISLVRMLLSENIVTAQGVLQWSLAGGQGSLTTIRWWELVDASLQVGGSRLFSGVVTDYGKMITDDEEESKAKSRNVRNAEAFVNFAAPILKGAIEQTISSLSEIEVQEGGKKMSPLEVDLIEGCKVLVQSSKSLFFSCLDDARMGMSTASYVMETREAYASSELTGPSLARLCPPSDSVSVKILAQILEGSK